MPDPERTARRAVSLLMRAGLGRLEATVTVSRVVLSVEQQLHAAGMTDTRWLFEIRLALVKQYSASKGGQRRKGVRGDKPASQLAAEWAANITREAERRGIVGHGPN